MRRSIVVFVLLLAACGGGSGGLEGGSVFTGTFESGPGVTGGEISFVISDDATAIDSANLGYTLNAYPCGPGTVVSGGGYSVTWTPGLEIVDDAFSGGGFSGTFDSPTEAHGLVDLEETDECPGVIAWTASVGE